MPADGLYELLQADTPKANFRCQEEHETLDTLPWDTHLVALITSDLVLERGVVRVLRDMYRVIEALTRRGVEVGSAVCSEDTVRLCEDVSEGSAGAPVHSRKVVYASIGVSINDPVGLGDVYVAVRAAKAKLVGGGKEKIVFVPSDRLNNAALRAIIDYTFYGLPAVSLSFLSAPRSSWSSAVGRSTGRLAQVVRQGTRVAKVRSGGVETVEISAREGQTYADLLREVKRNVDVTNMGVEVNSTRKSRAGHLILAVKKKRGSEAEDGVENFRAAIAGKVPGCRAIRNRRTKDKKCASLTWTQTSTRRR